MGKFGPVGEVEAHNFSYAQYDLAPGPSNPLYRLHYPHEWHDIDATGWLDELAHKLPKSLSVQQGVYPDYAAMTTETPLSREQDPLYCPEGGEPLPSSAPTTPR